MRQIRYFWEYYIKPILFGVDPNSKEGLELRIERLKKDGKGKG